MVSVVVVVIAAGTNEIKRQTNIHTEIQRERERQVDLFSHFSRRSRFVGLV